MIASDAQALLLERAAAAPVATKEAVEAAATAHGLVSVPTFLTPLVLPASARSELAHIAETLHRALARMQRAYFETGLFSDVLTLAPGVAELAVPVAGDPTLVSCRLDVLVNPLTPTDDLAVVGVHTGDPSGLGWTDLLWDGLAATPGVAALAERAAIEPPKLVASHRAAALAVYARWCAARDVRPAERPNVAFACARRAAVRSDHEAMAKLWRRAGHDAVVVDPRELNVVARRLYAGGDPIDLLVRDTHHELLGGDFREETSALRDLLADDALCCINPLRDVLLDDKASLAALTNPAVADFFDPEERRLIAAHVPATRVFSAAFVDELEREQKDWVLKPRDGDVGFGVTLGAFVAADEWSHALADGQHKRTVAQRAARVPRAALRDETGSAHERYCALSLWVHGGRFSGAFARLSDAPVVNVHQGGGIVPAVFVG